MPTSPLLPTPTPWRQRARLAGTGLLALLLLLGLGALLSPPGPGALRFAAGPADGAYYQTAIRYRDILSRDHVALTVLETAGAAENLRLLAAGEVELGLLQGGLVADPPDGLVALGSLFVEPVWLFARQPAGAEPIDDLGDLAGRRVAVGAPGSGTSAVVQQLLDEVALPVAASRLPLSGPAARDALRRGEADAVLAISAARSPLVQGLAGAPGVALVSLRRAEAWPRLHPFLTVVHLPEGALDMAKNLPPGPVELLAVTASLAAREDLDPGVIALLLRAATEVHSGGGLFEAPGEFPSPAHCDLPVSADARDYYARGPSFLLRFFPYRVAAWIQRLLLVALPLITLAIPLSRVGPPLYRWGIRSRITRWYRVLREVDATLARGDAAAMRAEIARLDRLEEEVIGELRVPLSYMDELYSLRLHLGYLRERLKERIAALESPPPTR